MPSQFSGRPGWVALAALLPLLGACRSVPDMTRVPVPNGPTVFHGSYAGTLTEGLFLRDAVLGAGGQVLYVVARTSGHTTLLELDPATGQERRRAEVAVNDPREVAWRADGVLVVAGWGGSAVVDPATLTLLRALPPAERVSRDGETLLRPNTVDTRDLVLLSSRTGATVSRVVPPDDEPRFGVTGGNLIWLARWDGGALLNLRTGQRVETPDHPDPCRRGSGGVGVLGVEDTPTGPVLSLSDGTVEWRNPDGTLRSGQNLNLGCELPGISEFRLEAEGASVLFHVERTTANARQYLFGRLSEGTPPRLTPNTATIDPAYGNWFGGTFAYRTADRLLLAANGTEPVLEGWPQWKRSYLPARSPVRADIQASFRNAETYDLSGEWTGPTGPLTLRGTGTSSTGGPAVVFTQATCSVPPFGPNCPVTSWEASLYAEAGKVGSVYSAPLDPNLGGGGRRSHGGNVSFVWNGETRSFTFDLSPR